LFGWQHCRVALQHLLALNSRFDKSFNAQFGMQSTDKPPGFLVCRGMQDLPLGPIERGRRQDWRRNRQAIGCEIFEQTERQRKGRYRAGSRCPQEFIHPRRFVANGLERVSDNGARAVNAGSRDQVDQLPPAHRGIVAVVGRLAEDGQ
jgi:hypothetical protein